MFYIVTEKTLDGEFEYYGVCIIKLQEGEKPSPEVFLEKMYEDEVLEFDKDLKAWQVPGDYRLLRIYNWKRIESEEDKEILNKYGVI